MYHRKGACVWGGGGGGGHALWFEPTHISQCEVAPTCFVDECRWAVKSLLHHLTGLCQREGGWLAVWLDSLPPPPLLGGRWSPTVGPLVACSAKPQQSTTLSKSCP
jgi:hypothetical protein